MTFLCFHITTFLFIFCKQHYGRQNFTFVSLCWQFFCLTSLKVSPGSSDVVKLCASLLCGASLQWDSETVKGEQAGWRSDWSTVNKKLQHSTKSIKSTLYRKFKKLLQPIRKLLPARQVIKSIQRLHIFTVQGFVFLLFIIWDNRFISRMMFWNES